MSLKHSLVNLIHSIEVIHTPEVNGGLEGYLGLFGMVEWPGAVTNLGLEGVQITSQATYAAVGGLAGDLGWASISNCYSMGSVSASGISSIGGLVGRADGEITNSDTGGLVSATSRRGSIGSPSPSWSMRRASPG